MGRIFLVSAAILIGFNAAASAADEPGNRPGTGQQTTPTPPPAGGNLSNELNRSGGVITPPADVDPEMKQTPPPSGSTMPVIPPPGTPGGNPAIKPK
jgi:hypothetical protein